MSRPQSINRAEIWRYAKQRLRQSNTYAIAFLVGSFINIYGHWLVPTLRGNQTPLRSLSDNWVSHPILTGLTILLAYVFPLLVGVYSAVMTRISLRHVEARAQFPDAKPDPVFRATRDGQIIDLGERTVALFRSAGVRSAQDFLGNETWQQMLIETSLDGRWLVFCERLDAWFAISCAKGPSQTLNVYGTRTVAPNQMETMQ